MGGKPRQEAKKLDPTNLSREDLKEISGEMAGILVWCLCQTIFPDGLMFNQETGEMNRIEDKVFNALDKIGYVVDRPAYYEAKRDMKKGKRGGVLKLVK